MAHPPIGQQIMFLRTNDMPATAQFYEEVLGLPLALDQGHCRMYRVSGNGYIGFCTNPASPQQPSGVCFTMVTPQVDEWYEYLQERGVHFEKTPTLDPKDNVYHCFLRDPNGYLLEFQRFVDDSWDES